MSGPEGPEVSRATNPGKTAAGLVCRTHVAGKAQIIPGHARIRHRANPDLDRDGDDDEQNEDAQEQRRPSLGLGRFFTKGSHGLESLRRTRLLLLPEDTDPSP